MRTTPDLVAAILTYKHTIAAQVGGGISGFSTFFCEWYWTAMAKKLAKMSKLGEPFFSPALARVG